MSKIETVTSKLRVVHLQSLFAALYYGLSPIFDFWIQHCYPEDAAAHAKRIDDTLARACVPGIPRGDSITLRRVRLPVRRLGLGLRSRFDLAPAAFLNTVSATLPLMLDQQDRRGVVQPGFLPQLEPLLGAGSFDWNNEDNRFRHLL